MRKTLKSAVTLLLLTIILLLPLTAYAGEKHPDRIVDKADLLTAEEEGELTAITDEISNRQKFDIVIMTAPSAGDVGIQAMAQDFYDNKGYGFGKKRDGVILLLTMDDRQWYVSTTGYGITAITDDGRNYIADAFLSNLKEGNYAAGFTTFAELCDDFVTEAKEGKPYDGNHMPRSSFEIIITVAAGVIIGFLIALGLGIHKKKEMKTIELQEDAYHYTCEGSVNLKENHDRFVHQFVTTRIIEDHDSGGSKVSRGSSGTSHGGGGGSF